MIHQPDTTNEARREAEHLIEEVKNKVEEEKLIGFAIQLIPSSNSSILRHFGFHLFLHFIKNKWNSLSPQQRDQIKGSVLQVIAEGTKKMEEEEHYIKEKVVSLVIEVAKREWPQRWSDLFTNLFHIATLGVKCPKVE